jgi:hypothetical protein
VTALSESIPRAAALATAALAETGPDRALVAQLLAEIDEEDRAEAVTLAIVFAAVGEQVCRGIALTVAQSKAARK